MFKTYNEVVNYLESLQIMPKTMPGLEKIKKALVQTSWYVKIDPNKVIVVAGTNGKGTTSAALEALLLKADQRVGFYSSPHLVRTTERIRFQGVEISEIDFIQIFSECFELIKNCELSHFEALTLMAGHYYFSSNWQLNIDFVIFEVGLGGTYDATNAFPHKYCVITKLGSDHVNILGATLTEIAINKFGVVGKKNIVVHHELPTEVLILKAQYQKSTNSNWVESEKYQLEVNTDGAQPRYFLTYNNCKFQINILGARAAENIMTAIKTFEILGFDSDKYYSTLNEISWQGRMQKVKWPSLNCSMYLSGDHNLQGAQSLVEIVKDFRYNFLHLIVGIGVDKDASSMLEVFSSLKNVKLYLTETPFKGIEVEKYSETYLKKSVMQNKDISILLCEITDKAEAQDLVLVTGSLYLVGEVLKLISLHPVN